MEIVETVGLDRPVLEAARNLLGCFLVRKDARGTRKARVVETEAYSEADPASHSYNGPTPRSRVMFGPPGVWYVYKCYGIHWMLNVVTGDEDTGEAVLIRAAEPVEGRDRMIEVRNQRGVTLTNGPGKLAEALSIDDRFDSESVDHEKLFLTSGEAPEPVFESPRVGIEEDRRRYWRFYLGNEYVSDVSQNDVSRRRD